MIQDAFLDSVETAAALLHEPALSERWSSPSALPGYSTGGLARHLANQITHTPTYLTTPPRASAISLLNHFTGNAWLTSGPDSPDNTDIRHRSEQAAAATTPGDLAAEADAALRNLRTMLPTQSSDRIVDLGDWGLTLNDFLLTRVLELVVHADDLAVSLNIPTPPMPTHATEATIHLLTRIATWRHGPLNVIRALTRQERAPATIAAL